VLAVQVDELEVVLLHVTAGDVVPRGVQSQRVVEVVRRRAAGSRDQNSCHTGPSSTVVTGGETYHPAISATVGRPAVRDELDMPHLGGRRGRAGPDQGPAPTPHRQQTDAHLVDVGNPDPGAVMRVAQPYRHLDRPDAALLRGV